MKKLFYMVFLCGLCVYTPAHASDLRMDEVVVSAHKIETSASEATSSVTVITEEDLELQQNHSLVDALKNTPGVFMGSNMGPAGLNTIKIRGSHQRYTQLRYNGIPLREAGAVEGGFDALFGVLSIAPGAIERIEVLKGSQSTLYGSSALGGVISVYTGSRWDSGFSASLDVSGGSWGTRTVSSQVSFGDERYYLNFTPLYTASDGFNDIWYEQGGFSLGAGLYLSEKTSVEFISMLTAFENASVDAPYWNEGQWSKLYVYERSKKSSGQVMLNGMTVTHDVNDRWTVQGKAAFSSTERKYRHYATKYAGDAHYLELLSTLRPLENLTVIAGTEYEGQSMELRSSGLKEQEKHAGTFSVYTKGLLSFLEKKFVLSVGGRFNKHEDFDSKATWDLGLSYSFDTGTRVFGNAATGFYSPSLYQRYGDGSWVNGNPNLKSESSVTYELGVEQKLWNSRLLLSASIFASEYKDQVSYNAAGYYYNADKAKARGFELGLCLQPDDSVRFDFGYTHVSSKQKADMADWVHGSQLPEDKVMGTLYLFPLDRLTLSVAARWEGERKDAKGKTMDDAFFTVDLAASYELSEHVQLYAKVSNLLDEDYAVYGWEMPGVNATAGARFRF